ncbi:hypothetical protein [Ruegeria meonggei]|uniref:Uncharacterized protein n=1 Tax=Ruegeria meonggei TaxID=1446476 RepID=A0A1X6ZY90_9RHOB|nr:hypothetical protein [Ruegeria meonggei]SLN65063.1 hypothetical protein RUM8411_03229 [Ruegeria meonggei]
MQATEDKGQGLKVKAERILPTEEMGQDEFEGLAGEDAPLIHSGHVQFWRVGDTVGQFTASAPQNVWHLDMHITELDWDILAKDMGAILNGFWGAQKPAYVTTHTIPQQAHADLMQSLGFHKIGYLPLTVVPVIVWGWRQCH